jgi:hypothetical protein
VSHTSDWISHSVHTWTTPTTTTIRRKRQLNNNNDNLKWWNTCLRMSFRWSFHTNLKQQSLPLETRNKFYFSYKKS